MKTLNKIITILILYLISNNLFAQPGHGMIKQPPRINGAMRGVTNASVNARIHANSNSVFGIGNSHPNYNKKEEPKKEERKDDGETKKKEKGKKEKK